jgi:hypothetical protein
LPPLFITAYILTDSVARDAYKFKPTVIIRKVRDCMQNVPKVQASIFANPCFLC